MHYRQTLIASFVGYIVQAMVNNFIPLLFLLFRKNWGFSLDQIAFLATFNFAVQLVTDLFAPRIVKKIGTRSSVVLAHIFATIGLVGLAFLPDLFPSPYVGLLTSILFYAIGGGLIEVLISPIVEACPTKHKAATMSLLHSFYCWGLMATVAISTLFFVTFGMEQWRILSLLFAIVPACNAIFFCFVPLNPLEEETKQRVSVKQLFSTPLYWLFLLLMLCAGASELSVAQWASALAEAGLGVSKTVGDLAGPLSFAGMMGISRVAYAKFSQKISLTTMMMGSGILSVISYLMISLAPTAAIGLIGCGLCGFSVGIMWPGTYSLAAKKMGGGSTSMFAYLALAGDAGCSLGPGLVGIVSAANGDRFQLGILAATVFPLMLIVGMLLLLGSRKKRIPTQL